MGFFDSVRSLAKPKAPTAPTATGLVAPPSAAPSPAVKPPTAPATQSPTGVNFGGAKIQPAIGSLPMTPQAPATPQVPGGVVAPINPAGSLRGSTILPGQGLNRGAYAQQALQDFDASRVRPQREAFQQVGQQAAKFGRLGMGDTAREARDVGVQFEAERQRMANDLAWQLAEAEQNDARGYRDEARGERGYTDALEGQAFDRRVGQYDREQDAMNQAFLRALQQMQAGNQNNPANAMLGASGDLGMQSGQAAQSLAELMRQMAARRPASGGITGGTLPAGTRVPDGGWG
jgi:hypothetical protein